MKHVDLDYGTTSLSGKMSETRDSGEPEGTVGVRVVVVLQLRTAE